MWRALFLATGVVLCILGAECLVLEKAVLAKGPEKLAEQPATLFSQGPVVPEQKEIKPPEWAPWSLLAGGVVVILYSYSIPRRNG